MDVSCVFQLGEMEFHVTGGGTLPQPQEPVSITSLAGSNTTLIIPFRNPLDIPVFVDVFIKGSLMYGMLVDVVIKGYS